MSTPLALIALAAAALAGALLAWLILRARYAALAERAKNALADNDRLTAERSQFSALNSQLSTTLAAERAAAAEKLAALTDAHQRLTTEFKALSADALRTNNEAFLKLAQATLEKFSEGAKGDLAARQQAIDALVKPLRESLDKVGVSVAEIEKNRVDAYGRLSEQLKTLGTAQTSLQAEAAKLSTALRSTTTAGTWGELQLRRVVEMAGMTAYCDFSEQQATGDRRADLVVRLPGGQQIVIDAKAPNEAYREAANTADESIRAAKLAEHAAKVRGHIDALGAKGYWEQFQPSPEFVVLFLPGDQFLSGALQADPSLIDRAVAKKVLLATPATLIALLKAAAWGWRQEDVARNAGVIADLGRALYDRIATFADNLDKVGRGLESANKAYNAAVGSFEQSVLPGARKFSELGAKGVKELAEPAAVEATPRDVLKRA
ncbi:MAG TPA: DNA recombination protein RmuC [Opitutus sp.]|nr:DNA recombination protein RmuC [Opitutus sp.]